MPDIVDEKPLLQSGVGDRIWNLYHTDPEAFKREVKAYFERGLPGWTVVSFNPAKKIIWLRDERRERVGLD